MRLRISGAGLLALILLVLGYGAANLVSAPSASRPKRSSAQRFRQPLDFIRPGLVVKIQAARLTSDGTVTAQFTLADPMGVPLNMDGTATPGPITVNLVAAYIPTGQSQYVSYTTRFFGPPDTKYGGYLPHADIGGAYQKTADGQYTYTFATRVPPNYDIKATHTIGLFAYRDLTDFDLGTQYGTDLYSFVPDGSPVKTVRDIIGTSSCNQCHGELAYHEGKRRGVGLCVLCHTPQNVDLNTGQSFDFPVLIHKIHAGSHLHSAEAGGTYEISVHDFTGTQDYSVFEPVADPRSCQVCHRAGPTQADRWATNPSRTACGSCHDTVNFATGDKHVGGPQANDKLCSACHAAKLAQEFDPSIPGAHTIANFSSKLAGVVFSLVSVDNARPGKRPTVNFTVSDKSGKPIAASAMDRLALVIAGPTADYATWVQEDARKAGSNSDGTYSFTFQAPLPNSAKGTYTAGIEGYRLIKQLPGTKQSAADIGDNKMLNFSVDGSDPQPRRTIVSAAKCASCHQPQPMCNTCHSESLHNANRNQPEYCVLCHNPNETDKTWRPADQMPAESMDFAVLVHKIHTGENREWRTIFGIGGVEDEYSTVRYPGDLRVCDKCHVNGSEQLPLAGDRLPVSNPPSVLNPMGRATAACLGCHDTADTASHALSSTSSLGESCAACHGNNAEFSVSKVHSRPN